MNSVTQNLWCRTIRHRHWAAVALYLFLVPTVGCSSSPEFNILGSYFPAWLVCIAIAIPLTLMTHVYATKTKLAEQFWPLPIVYTALLCLLSCTLWLIFFE